MKSVTICDVKTRMHNFSAVVTAGTFIHPAPSGDAIASRCTRCLLVHQTWIVCLWTTEDEKMIWRQSSHIVRIRRYVRHRSQSMYKRFVSNKCSHQFFIADISLPNTFNPNTAAWRQMHLSKDCFIFVSGHLRLTTSYIEFDFGSRNFFRLRAYIVRSSAGRSLVT